MSIDVAKKKRGTAEDVENMMNEVAVGHDSLGGVTDKADTMFASFEDAITLHRKGL